MAGLALLDGGAQFGELVADELAQPNDRLTLPRVAAHQIGHPVERCRKLLDGRGIRFEITVAAGQQIPALAGLRALHQVEHPAELLAHRQRMLHPLAVALVARVEPEGGRHDHGRQRRGNEEAPIEQSERFGAGQRGAHDACDFAGALASADGQFPVRAIDMTVSNRRKTPYPTPAEPAYIEKAQLGHCGNGTFNAHASGLRSCVRAKTAKRLLNFGP